MLKSFEMRATPKLEGILRNDLTILVKSLFGVGLGVKFYPKEATRHTHHATHNYNQKH
jgi:hypothetical protein